MNIEEPIIGNAFCAIYAPGAHPVSADPSPDPDDVADKFIRRGFLAFQLRWEMLFVAQLAIEDDVRFLVDAAIEVEGLRDGHVHYVYLGDGEVIIDGKVRDRRIEVAVVHTQGGRTVEHQREYALDAYVGGWRLLVAMLVRG